MAGYYGLSCASTTIKYLLFFFNFVFVLAGIALIAVGAVALKAKSVAGSGYTAAIVLIIVVGCIIFVVSFFGCCGAVRENSCMLTLFGIFLMTIIVVEVVGMIMIFVDSGSTDLQKNIDTVFNSAYYGDSAAMDTVESLQSVFKCCGYNSTTYWTDSSYESELEKSCLDSSKNTYTETCKHALTHFLELYGKIVGAVAIAIAVMEVLGVWFSLGLAGSIRRVGYV